MNCRMSKNLCTKENGFTLLEVLLAFFIFTILFITIYTSYSSSFKTVNMTENRMELYRRAAITLERISEDLQASYISVLLPNSFGRPAGYTRFLGEDKEINGHKADTVRFFSRLSPLFSEADETASGQLISYSLVQGDHEDELILLRTENPEFIDEAEEREGLVLSDSLYAVNFIYVDGLGEQHESWDSDSEEFGQRLPRMVTIELDFLDYDNPEEPLKVMTSVVLPVNYVPKL